MRRFLPLLALCAVSTAGAQSVLDIGARIAPQYYSYKLDAPSNTKITEFALPLFVVVPVTSRLSFDVGTSYTNAKVEQTGSKSAASTISGLTDTQIRGNLILGNDFVVLTGGVNLPTGKSTVGADQQLAASLIGSDFLSFPISNMGTGLGGTGGIAIAQPVGDWNLGVGVSMRRSAEYEPFAATGATALHYQPGNEYRARVGIDRPVGTGHVMLGVTYSTFGDDNLAGSVYNTGNRLISQLDFNNNIDPARLSITGWDLYRAAGTLADSSNINHENIANGALALGFPVGSAVIEPNVEGRAWMQVGASTSYLGSFGLRLHLGSGNFAILPSAAYTVGQLAAQDLNGVNTTATLTGFHATLAIRLR